MDFFIRFLKLFYINLIVRSQVLEIYESNLPIENNNNNEITGLKYIKSPKDKNVIWSKGISACIRFKNKKLNNILFAFGQNNLGGIYLDTFFPLSIMGFEKRWEWIG